MERSVGREAAAFPVCETGWDAMAKTCGIVLVLLMLGDGAAILAADAREMVMAEAIDKRIRQHRTAEVTLTVTGPAGKPLADTPVTVRQVRHKFLFGCNAYMLGRVGDAKLEEAYREQFAELLNYATLPFYWGSYERQRGKPDAARVRAMAQWCAAEGIRTKGHPLVWHEVPAAWLAKTPLADVRRLQTARIRREMTAFAGLIDTWDVLNEAVAMPNSPTPVGRLCKKLGRAGLIAESFAAARAARPAATLVLNDYRHDKAFEGLVGEGLAAGVGIDVIGLQSHMHKRYLGAKRVWEVCERFARFSKPLHWTEATIVSGHLKTDNDWHGRHPGWDTTPAGEARQAKQVREFYRVLFSHPAVEAITWWDFSDRGAWQGAPAGLVRKDMTPKPAYLALHKLIKGDWWTGELKRTTDAAGRVTFRGFLGRYQAEAGGASGQFDLDTPGRAKAAVKLTAD